ncbi:MAG: M15 family metallopeptidase [Oligoflexia bacterium]|nr:M15 family metallopeptidase [Oligoflexia bacterium]
MRMTLEQAIQKYGPIVDGVWANEAKFCSLLEIPSDIGGEWINSATGLGVTHIYVNNDMQAPLLQALNNVKDRGLLGELHSFDGCLMIRAVRGQPGNLSCHAYGLAIDLDASDNQMGTAGTLSPEFVKCFTDEGFTWGGTFHTRTDPMHFSLAWE